MRKILALAAMTCLLPQPLLAADRVELQRNGKWAVDWTENSCALIGSFGTADKPVALKFIQSEPGGSFTLQAFGLPFPIDETTGEIEVNFSPNGISRQQVAMHGNADSLPFVDLGINRLDDQPNTSASAVSPKIEAQADSVTLTPLRGTSYRLDIGPMQAPMNALRDCTTDLVKRWGYDPTVQAGLSRPAAPVTDSSAWLTARDYPESVFRSGSSAVVKVRLDIDESGAITGCHVIGSAKAESMESATCERVTKRAKLAPALDAQGKPVKSYFVNEYRWAMVDR